MIGTLYQFDYIIICAKYSNYRVKALFLKGNIQTIYLSNFQIQ